MIYGHGDDHYKYDNISINFSSNVCPGGMNLGLKSYLINCLEDSCSYPEPRAKELEQLIEWENQLPQGSVLATNGAVEAFYLIAAWKKNCRSLVYIPAFSEYEDACRTNKHLLEFRSNTEVATTLNYTQEVVWLCNPNNPDGKVFNRDFLQNVINQNKKTLFVIDEAYIDFIEEDISLINVITKCKNLIITRSLTKRYAIPGLRIGYVVADPEIISELEKNIIPWRINLLAQKAGLYCLSGEYKDDFNLPVLIEESKRLQNEIGKVNGFLVQQSNTTFFLVKTSCKASELKEELARKYGILIRDASNFRGLSDYHFRISSQSSYENDKLLKALNNIVSKDESTRKFKYTSHA